MAKVIIFSGAGISAESGIDTFRGQGGLWGEYDIKEVCTAGCLDKNREKVISFYDKRRVELKSVLPNKAHETVASLKNSYPEDIDIITQNVDDLFERSGCEEVIHLHGYLPNIRCRRCAYREDIGYTTQDRETRCPKCNNTLRPDIVFLVKKPHSIGSFTSR